MIMLSNVNCQTNTLSNDILIKKQSFTGLFPVPELTSFNETEVILNCYTKCLDQTLKVFISCVKCIYRKDKQFPVSSKTFCCFYYHHINCSYDCFTNYNYCGDDQNQSQCIELNSEYQKSVDTLQNSSCLQYSGFRKCHQGIYLIHNIFISKELIKS